MDKSFDSGVKWQFALSKSTNVYIEYTKSGVRPFVSWPIDLGFASSFELTCFQTDQFWKVNCFFREGWLRAVFNILASIQLCDVHKYVYFIVNLTARNLYNPGNGGKCSYSLCLHPQIIAHLNTRVF